MTTALSSLERRLAGIGLIAFVAVLYAQDAIDPTDVVDNAERWKWTPRHARVVNCLRSCDRHTCHRTKVPFCRYFSIWAMGHEWATRCLYRV
jgi:hypothetical protein